MLARAAEKLMAWVDARYTRVPLREKDTGTKLEALRDFRRRNCVLPPGAQHIEGSLMHQAAALLGGSRHWGDEGAEPSGVPSGPMPLARRRGV